VAADAAVAAAAEAATAVAVAAADAVAAAVAAAAAVAVAAAVAADVATDSQCCPDISIGSNAGSAMLLLRPAILQNSFCIGRDCGGL